MTGAPPNGDATCEAVALLHVLVRRSWELADKSGGPTENLAGLLRRLALIRGFDPAAAVRTTRIGVFGPPNRGKSTLLNALLGCPVLPAAPVPLTGTVIEISQDNSVTGFDVTVFRHDGSFQPYRFQQPMEVAELITRRGSHLGRQEPVPKIEIRAPFPACRVLVRGGTLLDTPGAEIAFAEREGAPGEDTRRALAVLSSTHVVLFCLRADELGTRSEEAFYERHLRILAPLNVINFKDKWIEDETSSPEESEDALVTEAVNRYDLPRQRCVAISAKWALSGEPERAARSGLAELEAAILAEEASLDPKEGFAVSFAEHRMILRHHSALRPERIYHEHLRQHLQGCPADWNAEARATLDSIFTTPA